MPDDKNPTRVRVSERVNYAVFARCLDCGHEYEIDSSCVNPSKDVIVNSRGVRCRVLVVAVQNECQLCLNLRVVESSR